MFNIDEITVNTNRNLLGIENELIENVINFKGKGNIRLTFMGEIKKVLSKNTAELLYRFNRIYNNTNTINKYFDEIQSEAEKGEDILKLHEFYYLFNILVNEEMQIKINYIIRKMNFLFKSYYISAENKELIKKEIKTYLDFSKELISYTCFYNALNQIAIRIVSDTAKKFNLDNKKAI